MMMFLIFRTSAASLALLALALSTGLLEIELSQPIIAAIIISMALSPMLIRNNEAIANRFAPDYVSGRKQAGQDIEQACEGLKEHVSLPRATGRGRLDKPRRRRVRIASSRWRQICGTVASWWAWARVRPLTNRIV